jgi:hypothetical protein
VKSTLWKRPDGARRYFIGGSDARIILGDDETALLRLWREKRGEVEPEDRSANWYKTITGRMPVGRYIVGSLLRDRCHFPGMVALEHSSDPACVAEQVP